MLRSTRQNPNEREEGFTLIELLVVVIIIGILAAIAIPVFLNQREKAWDAAAKSDLKNAQISQESYLEQHSAYATSQAQLETQGFKPSEKVSLSVVSASTSAYCMKAFHQSHTTAVFYLSSASGAPSTTACS